MRQLLKNKLKEQKGLTLIELLAVIVILGIIAAIAVPSILGLIDNSKKDAHVANAQQMINAAKMAVASESDLQTGTHYLSLATLEDKQYLDPVESPDDEDYDKGSAATDDDPTTTVLADVSFVKLEEGKIVEINLETEDSTNTVVRSIHETAASGAVISSQDIERGDVTE